MTEQLFYLLKRPPKRVISQKPVAIPALIVTVCRRRHLLAQFGRSLEDQVCPGCNPITRRITRRRGPYVVHSSPAGQVHFRILPIQDYKILEVSSGWCTVTSSAWSSMG